MSIIGSLQLSHELGIRKSHGCRNQFMSVAGRGRLHPLSVSLSSHASRQDAWSIRVSESVHKPLHSLPSRYNVFICRSSLVPVQANGLSILKNATVAFTRSCNVLHGSPLILQLAPALGIIAFAIWGLGPLTRWSRNLFFHKSDSSWKRSATHYVMTSYLQPLLLWSGATLMCRVLDPVVLPTEVSHAVKQRLLNFVRSLSTVLAFAYCLSSLIQHAQKFFMETNESTDTRNMGFQFAGKAIYTAVWVAALSLFMELLGFSTQKWITAGGLGTVLLTLAGREIFTNFLSSVMIHATRPFVVSEWIQTKIEGYEVSGTVEHVGWWSPTIIRGEDREAVHIPNHKFTVTVVRNLTQKTHWRIKTHLAISHLDVNKINNIVADMRKVLAKNPQVEQQKLHRRVFLENINPENQALLILVSCFVKTSHFEEYLCVKEGILLDLLRVISHHRARLATPIRTVQKIYSDADMENIPFAETIFNRAGAATKRPFLLIEPPYKINGDDKVKAQPRSVRTNEEQDGKPTSIPADDSNVDTKAGSTPKSESRADPNSERKQPKKANPGDDKKPLPKSRTVGKDSTVEGPASDRPPSTVSEIGIEKSDGAATVISHTKQDSERVPARTALEENIILGVALEGSKRTLPIDEDMTPPPPPPSTDAKDLVASRNKSGSLSSGKDKKESQIPAVPVPVPGAATGGGQ